MKYTVATLFLFFSFHALGQGVKLRYTTVDESCIDKYDTPEFIDSFYYDLPDIKKSDYKTYIRFKQNGQIVDFFSKDNRTYNGTVTNFVFQKVAHQREKKKTKLGSRGKQIIVQKLQLDSDTCTQIVQDIIRSGQMLLTSLSGFGADCSKLQFVFKINDSYIHQEFSCIDFIKDRIKEKAIISSNVQLISERLKLESPLHRLPSLVSHKEHYNYTYSIGSNVEMMITTKRHHYSNRKYKMIVEEIKNNKSLDTIYATLNYYIETELKKILSSQIRGYGKVFILHFSKSNRLSKITTRSYPSNNEDKISRDCRECKRKLRKAFRKINLDFVHSNYRYSKKILFDINESPQIENVTY